MPIIGQRQVSRSLTASTAIIEFHRGDGWTDAMRRWSILIDDIEVGHLRRLRTAAFNVEAGQRLVQIRIALFGSPHLILRLGSDECAVLGCRPRHGLFGQPAHFTDRIILERVR